MSMVDGFPYKEEVGGSNPSVPTIYFFRKEIPAGLWAYGIVRQGTMTDLKAQLSTFRVCMRSRSSVG
jgi:hypothetical protein